MSGKRYLQLVEQFLGRGSQHDDVASGGLDEPFLHGLVDERQQGVVVAVHV